MNVVYVSNEAYAQHFAVSLASLCDCNPDEEELKIYLLDTGILPETAEKLKELAADFGQHVPTVHINDIRTVGQAQSRMQRGTPFAAVNLLARPQIMHSPSKPCRTCKVTEQLKRIFPKPVLAVIEQHAVQTFMHTVKAVRFAGKTVTQKDMSRILMMLFKHPPHPGKSIHDFP